MTDLVQRAGRREVYPSGLREILVTEDGAAIADIVTSSGEVHDEERCDYLAAAADAMAGGVPLGGYFVWSLMDDFEWYRSLIGSHAAVTAACP